MYLYDEMEMMRWRTLNKEIDVTIYVLYYDSTNSELLFVFAKFVICLATKWV